MNVKIDVHQQNFGSALSLVDTWNVPSAVKKEMHVFLDDLALGKVNRGKKIADPTRIKYIYLLRTPLEFFNKPINKIVKKDVEEFERALSSGKIQSYKKKPFTHSVIVDIRIALKTFLKWAVGEEKSYGLTDFLDTRDVKKTPDYLKESEVERLHKHCKSLQERYLLAVLFDSGARAEEFLNIRYEDIELPTKDQNFVKITLKEEYSKTAGRVISLYWHNSLESVRDYFEQRKREGIRVSEPVYNGTYDSIRSFLRRLGNKVLQRNINPHLFRHSSATHYASKLNRQELCYRYGWAFSSNMPDVYISRAGMQSEKLDEQFTQTEVGEVKDELSKEKQRNRLLEERYEQLSKHMQLMETALKQLAANQTGGHHK